MKLDVLLLELSPIFVLIVLVFLFRVGFRRAQRKQERRAALDRTFFRFERTRTPGDDRGAGMVCE